MTRSGLTLIELIIVIALFSILVVSILWIFGVGLVLWDSGIDRAEIRQSGNLAVEIMVRELSQASSISIASVDEIIFAADVDDDGSDDTISYDVRNSELIRTLGGVAATLVPDVETLEFSYRDLDDNLLGLPQDTASQTKRDRIRVIIISLTLDKADETISLSSSAYARNQ